MNEYELADKTCIKIIDLISKSKAINNTWKQFGRIFALMEYLIEYFDYFSKKENYGGKNNINEYNNIYEKAFENLNTKDEKLKTKYKVKLIILKYFLEIGSQNNIQVTLEI